MDSANASLAELLASRPIAEQQAFLRSLTEDEARALEHNWAGFWSRPKQLPPPGNWRYWLLLAGRGFGKTRTGAQWVIEQVERHGKRRIALVAETAADARDVIVEGESGILACSPPWNRPKYEPSKRRLTWPNGARATTYSADEPGQLRGPQHDAAWADELAKWKYPDAWDQLMLGLRLGDDPRCVITTTPRPTSLIKDLARDPLCVVTRGSTSENRANLAKQFLDAIVRKYEGTRLGRQELEAEILEDAPGALWKRFQIDADRVFEAPPLKRIIVAIDPSVSSDSKQAETGIVVAGLGEDGHGYALEDGSLERPTPEEWGEQSVALYTRHQANVIVGEVNNGGDLVEANVRAVVRSLKASGKFAEATLPFKQVRASRGKHVRAEPISSLAAQHRIHHVGSLPLLEDQLCQWEPGVSAWSPNRLDAYVWAFTELMSGTGPARYDASYDDQLPDMRI